MSQQPRWRCQLVKFLRYTPWRDLPGGGRSQEPVYQLPDGREVTWDDLPVGSMWHTDDEPHRDDWKDKPSWCVVLPGKTIWRIQHPGTNGYRWTMTGTPPDISTQASVNINSGSPGGYHGYVVNGWVTDDYDGRQYGDDGKLITAR